MCNRLIPNIDRSWFSSEYEYRHIPKNGIGYKIFRKGGLSLIDGESYVRTRERNGWIQWHFSRHFGFCFFRTRKAAEDCLDTIKKEKSKGEVYENTYLYGLWNYLTIEDLEVREIEYRRGLLERLEYNFTTTKVQRVALCKMFRILPEEST